MLLITSMDFIMRIKKYLKIGSEKDLPLEESLSDKKPRKSKYVKTKNPDSGAQLANILPKVRRPAHAKEDIREAT